MATLTAQLSGSISLDGRNIDCGAAAMNFTVSKRDEKNVLVGNAAYQKVLDVDDVLSGDFKYVLFENLDGTDDIYLGFAADSATNFFTLQLDAGKSMVLPKSLFQCSAVSATPADPAHYIAEVYAKAAHNTPKLRVLAFN